MRSRYPILFFVALAFLLGSVLGTQALRQEHFALTRGWEDATQPDSVLPFRVPRPGVNVDLTQYDQAALEIQLADMAALGITWVRQDVRWSEIEPVQGEVDWQTWDTIVEAVAAQPTLELVAVLRDAPAWARHPMAPDSPTAPPSEARQLGDFTRAFADRYGQTVDFYQIWDEPNLAAAWGGLDPRAADYVAMLEASYSAIHAVDEDATVITAGLAPTTETGARNFSEVLYLRAIYEHGGREYFDAVAGKPYGFSTGPEDRTVDANVLNFSRLILLREEMIRQGDGSKAVWGSHFGWNALPQDWQGAPSVWGSVTREQQLAFITAAYQRADREWPWLGGLILQHWQPNTSADDPQWGFSLVQQGETRVSVGADLFGQAEVATNGRFPAVNPYATFEGDWEYGDLGVDIGYTGNATFDFQFRGADLALELRRDNYRAYLFPTVDGEIANAPPVDNDGRSYVILTSVDMQPHTDVIAIASGLSETDHHASFVTEFGWDQWALAGFRVGTPADAPRYDFWLPVLSWLSIIAGIVGMISAWQMPKPARLSFELPGWKKLGVVGQRMAAMLASLLVMVGMLLTWHDSLPALLRRDPPALIVGLLTAGLVYVSPSLILSVIAGLILWLIIYQRLELGLLLVVLWAPFFLFPLELYTLAFSMAEVCVLLSFSVWLVQHAVQWAQDRTAHDLQASLSRQFSQLQPLDWIVVGIFALATLSLSWSDYPHFAFREWRTMILEPVLFYLMVRTTIRTQAEIVRLLDTFVLAATAAALIGLIMYVGGEGVVVAEGGTRRLAGVYGSPNNVGLMMERALPFALAYVLMSTRLARRLLAGLAAAIMLLAVVLSQSVGAILLGVPAAIALLLLLWNTRRALYVLAAGAVAALSMAIPLSQHPRFSALLDPSSGTSFFRLKLWQSAWHMLQTRPIRGLGLDQFLYYYRGRFILPEAWQEPSLSHPHNILLDFWTRLGLGGVLLLAGAQWSFWRALWCLRGRLKSRRELYAITIGAMGSMAGLLAHGLIDNSVFVLDLSYVFVLLLAIPSLLETLPD